MINLPLTKLLFIDIEAVGLSKNYDSCLIENPVMAEQFKKYYDWFLKRFPEDEELLSDNEKENYNIIFAERTALIPEFNKIICVSLAFVMENGEVRKVSHYGDDEKKLLLELKKTLIRCGKLDFYLCGHNIKNYDIPVIAKRMIVNGILPPPILPSHDTKPWDMKVLDTKEIWQYGTFGSIGSLDLLCANLGIKSSKNGEIVGKNVHKKYWEGDNLKKIVEYCEDDVEVLVNVTKYLKNLE